MILIKKNLTKKFQNMMQSTVTMILAPDGYGKTSYLKHFIKKGKIETIWIEEKQGDSRNIWNQFAKTIPSLCNHSNPESQAEIATLLMQWDQSLQKDVMIIFDDVHKWKKPEIYSILFMILQLKMKNLHFVVVAPYIPDVKLTKSYDEKACYTMSIQDFKLDMLDLFMIFKKKGIIIEREQVSKLIEYTKGWLPAIELAIRGYQEGGSFFDTSRLEELLSKGKLDDIKYADICCLIKLSYLDEFTIEQMNFICKNAHVEKIIIELAKNEFFIQKSDLHLYSFSPIFKSYLIEAKTRYKMDKEETYEQLANWYIAQNDYIKAIQLLMEGGVFEAIIKILSESKFSYMDVVPELIQEVFRRMPKQYHYQTPFVYLLYISDVITNVDIYQGIKLLEEFKSDLLNDKYVGDKEWLMGEYYYIRAFSKFNDVKLMMEDFHKAHDCFGGNPSKVAYPGMIASFGSYQLLYLYHHTLGNLHDLLCTIKEEAQYFIKISYGCNAGCEYQAEAEYNFLTGNYEVVESLAKAAYDIASMNRQASIRICADFQLCRLALLRNNQSQYDYGIHDLIEIRSRCELPVLEKEVDCALAYLSILKNEEDEIAYWIMEGDMNLAEIMHEAEGLPYIIHMLYLLKKKRYAEAEGCCKMIKYANQRVTHAFALLYAKMGEAIIYYQTRRWKDSMNTLKELLSLSEKDHIISIFLEFYKELYPIFKNYEIETEFEKEVFVKLEERNRKMNAKENNQFDLLTEREKEVARMYIDAFTSKEIAEELVISHNTALSHIKSIFMKLGINKKKELIELMDKRKQTQ